MYDNGAYRAETRTPIGMTSMGPVSSHRESGLPGYSSNQNVMHAGNDDSVLNLKRELRDHLATSNGNTADGEEGSTPTATTASTSEQDGDSSSRNSSSDRGEQDGRRPQANEINQNHELHDYQTMDSRAPLYDDNRGSTFRPPSSSTTTSVQKRSLPSVPPIPSEPGYAKPFAHTNTSLLSSPLHSGNQSWNQNPPPARPLDSPPRNRYDRSRTQSQQPPSSSFQYEQQHATQSSRLLETSLDDDPNTSVNFAGRRSRSVGQMLETNFDEAEQPSTSVLHHEGGGENTPLNATHSRSLGGSGVFKLSLGAAPLETDM